MSVPPTSVDLAPANPYSLVLPSPVLTAPGCAVRELDTSDLGGIVTRITTRHTRHDPVPGFAATPAGLIVTGLPAVSIRTLLKEDTRHWERSALPVIVSLRGETAELAEMASLLENVESIAGLLVDAEDSVVAATAAARRATPRPILAMLGHGPNLSALARETVVAGADALVVAAPVMAAGGREPLEGYLLGPAVFPLTLRALLDVRAAVEAPLVALGGIATPAFARAALSAGASAVMIDAARWGDPHAPAEIARET